MTTHDNETDEQRTARTPQQLTRSDLASMMPSAVEQARKDGRLDNILGVAKSETDLLERTQSGPVTRADLTALAALGRHDLIEKARVEQRIDGRLANALTNPNTPTTPED